MAGGEGERVILSDQEGRGDRPPRQRSGPLIQAEVEDAMLRINEQLELSTEQLEEWSDDAAMSEATWQAALAQVLVTGGAPVEVLKAEALLAHPLEHRLALVHKARVSACRARLETMRAQLETFRTIAANVRAQT